MMPEGVEHEGEIKELSAAASVTDSMMPEGVEHIVAQDINYEDVSDRFHDAGRR